MVARSPTARARWARQGLAIHAPLDKTTQAMLLRQLYLSHFELRRFEPAHEIARQALELGVLVDVFRQDAARAALAAFALRARQTPQRNRRATSVARSSKASSLPGKATDSTHPLR